MARKYPNDFTPDGVDIEIAFANDDLELKDILSQIANVGAINLSGEKRQSVLSAHVDSSGNPDYITATGLNVSIDGSTAPVILAFAAGFDDKGSVDLVDAIKTNVSAWTVPSNATVYLYVDKDASTGLLSYGYSTLPDLYQKSAPTAVLDQHWYDTNACKMKRYNGSAWEEKRRVFVGKVVASASTAAVIIYPLNSKTVTEISILSAEKVSISGNLVSPFSFKNKITNGNFTINHRGVSGTVTLAAGAYGHDRWKAGASGCTYTFTTVEGVTTLTITAGSLQQAIEGINLQTGTHVLSWTGTAQGKIGAGSYGASGVTGAATGGVNLTVEFSAGTLSKVQLEEGSVATTFEQRFIGLELQMCQRYYGIHNVTILSWFNVPQAPSAQHVMLPVRMRTVPTVGWTTQTYASNVYSLSIQTGIDYIRIVMLNTAAGTAEWNGTVILDAEI